MLTVNNSGRGGQTLSSGFGGKTQHFGIRTTKSTKRIGCASLKTIVESDKLIITDFDLIDELVNFVAKGTSYQADEGHHDDLVMCCVMFGWLINQDYFKEVTNINIRNVLYEDNLKSIEDSLLPFGLIDDGRDSILEEENGFLVDPTHRMSDF